jgi:caffeoyl-CoA O-methyltransferase
MVGHLKVLALVSGLALVACPSAQSADVLQAKARVDRQIKKMERRNLKHYGVTRADGRLLEVMVRGVRAKTVVEVGTSTGYSALWLARGLLETGGKLVTYEINARRARQARALFKDAGLSNRITLVEGDAHRKLASFKGTIDVLFLDADKRGYIAYLQKMLPKVKKGGLIIAHNMNFPRPDPRFVKAITESAQLNTVFLNMDGPGLSVSQKK